MKNTFLIIAMLLIFNSINGQNYFSVGPDLGLPANFGSSSKPGIGGSLEYVNKFSSKLGARIYAGYSRFGGKYFNDDVVTFLPLRAGLQAFLSRDVVFIYAEAGVAKFHARSSGTNNTNFSFAFGAGFKVPFLESKKFLQFSAYYNLYQFNRFHNYTWVNLRTAYGLSW